MVRNRLESPNKRGTVEFGDFVLTDDDQMFNRDGRSAHITPKAVHVLRELLNRPGELVSKAELIDAVWPDSYVEESNLKFTISMLRRALGDDPHHPKYIETVSRRGYRVVANVRISEDSTQPSADTEKASTIRRKSPTTGHNLLFRWSVRVVLAVAFIAVCVSGLLYSTDRRSDSTGRLLSTPFSSEKLVTGGGVPVAALSADSRILVYLLQQADKYGIWLRQMDTGINLEIVPATVDSYGGLALSPDGAILYFSRKTTDSKNGYTIYRVPTRGGIPITVITGTEGRISLSPDSRNLSYVRCPYTIADYCSLYIASAETGADEILLVKRSKPLRIGENQFSPDGKTIAFAAGHSETRANEFGLYEVEIDTAIEKPLAMTKFFNIKSVQWLADSSSLLMTALTNAENTLGIWQVSRPSGQAVRLTRDAESYSGLSIDRNNENLVATAVVSDFRVAVLDTQMPSARRSLVSGQSGNFAPGGRFYFSSVISGNGDIWSMLPDGSGQLQLTNDPWEDVCPVPSPDGSFVAFASNDSGEQHVYRVNPDGSERKRVSVGTGGVPMFISSDSRWIFYRSAIEKNLWRASAEGGEETLVLDKRADHYVYSPKLGKIAYIAAPTANEIVIADIGENRPYSAVKVAGSALAIQWDLSEESILCAVRTTFDRIELWRYSLDGTPGTFVMDLTSKRLADFSQSPDGRHIAVIEGDWRHDAVLIRGLK